MFTVSLAANADGASAIAVPAPARARATALTGISRRRLLAVGMVGDSLACRCGDSLAGIGKASNNKHGHRWDVNRCATGPTGIFAAQARLTRLNISFA